MKVTYICMTCGGSGEGRYEGARCLTCGGSGQEVVEEPDYIAEELPDDN